MPQCFSSHGGFVISWDDYAKDVDGSRGIYAQIFDAMGNAIAQGVNPPVLSNTIPNQTIAEDNTLNFQIPSNAFTDVDGPALTFSASLTDGSALPTWLSFNPAIKHLQVPLQTRRSVRFLFELRLLIE